MQVLIQFLFRLTFGLACGMALCSPRDVTSGYFRVHSYVNLGLMTLAALVALASPEFSIWPPIVAAACSYFASVFWLYESPGLGRPVLVATAIAALVGAWQTLGTSTEMTMPASARALQWIDPVAGGFVLGLTMAAMLLGHWYLNTPTMKLGPLRRLVALAAAAVALRAVLALAALGLQASTEPFATSEMLFLALRWLSGLLGAAVLYWMTWQTLKIPNTQSATGILYVAVIATFLGELTSQLLSGSMMFPL